MSLTTPSLPSEVGPGSTPEDDRPIRAPRELTPRRDAPLPSWPIDMVLWGFPVWWVLGMMPFILAISALIMATLLLIRTRVTMAPGSASWLAFVLWIIPCAAALDSAGRLVGFGQRAANLLAAAVALLYIMNAHERLPARRVINGLTALWCYVIVGGYLGIVSPGTRLVTPVGLLLPGAITSNELVYDLVFPPFAEVQQPYGAPAPFNRPAAPFPYTNGWGCAVAFLTPVAIAALLRSKSKRTRLFLTGMLVAAGVPALATLNRGMFLGLGLGVVYVSFRLLLRGKVLPFLAVTVVGLVAAFGFLASGLDDDIDSRTEAVGDSGGTNQGRATIYNETFERTLESPVVGYGAPRPSNTLEISAGTQGFIWQTMFSYGFVGLGLFLWFLWGTVWRTRRPSDTAGLWLHATLVVACLTIFYYGVSEMQMLTLILVAGILLRDGADRLRAPPPRLRGERVSP